VYFLKDTRFYIHLVLKKSPCFCILGVVPLLYVWWVVEVEEEEEGDHPPLPLQLPHNPSTPNLLDML
jgi:hypothetical protein